MERRWRNCHNVALLRGAAVSAKVHINIKRQFPRVSARGTKRAYLQGIDGLQSKTDRVYKLLACQALPYMTSMHDFQKS